MTERPLRVLAWPAYANRDNPYHALLHAHLCEQGVSVEEYSPAALAGGEWDVLHIHWPEFLLGGRPLWRALPGAAVFFARLVTARASGRRVVWTVHNLEPHDRRLGGRAVYRLLSHCVDAVIGLSEGSLAAARQRYPALRRRRGVVVPHGHFRGVYPRSCTKDDARRSLGLRAEDRVLLFFGSIRPYKHVDRLITTFGRTPGDRLRLVVAGKPTAALRQELVEAAALDSRVQLHLDFIPDDAVQRYVGAADLVVLPYDEGVLNSSVALLALSFDRPVLAPDVGSLPELQRTVGDQWVRTFDRLTPDVLLDALDVDGVEGEAPLHELAWDTLAGRTAALYRTLVGRSAERIRSQSAS